MNATNEIKIGTKVEVALTPDAPLCQTAWWPTGTVTGTVQKIYKNGTVLVAIDQIRNGSQDRKKSMNFSATDLKSI